MAIWGRVTILLLIAFMSAMSLSLAQNKAGIPTQMPPQTESMVLRGCFRSCPAP
jgi:hypothetical protein